MSMTHRRIARGEQQESVRAAVGPLATALDDMKKAIEAVQDKECKFRGLELLLRMYRGAAEIAEMAGL